MKKKFLIVYFILLTIIIAMTVVLGKYLQELKNNTLYEAENFYFRSDLLSEDIKSYTLQRGVNKIVIHLYNSEDRFRYTKVDINYVVKLEKINDDGNLVKVREKNGVLSKSNFTDNEVVFDNLENGKYKVSALATNPYTKILEENFVITNNDNRIDYSVGDNVDSTVMFLTIKTVDYTGNIKIKFPDGLYPDNNEEAFKNVNIDNLKEVIVNFKNNSSYSYRFYKENPKKVFNKDEFQVGGV